ncbi:MAG TPA: bifunctional methylenetetrahydrofolate dehydrogenase/methenyltetrahydrofolate cyclohydrolase FolD [Gaiellales bacterium]|jgi:methylenetetrahydrofolate dehydrogenase (NADP+)/methenyltetrahydrofolate cyclohydrolase
MTAAIIDGAAVSARVRQEVAGSVAELIARGGPTPGLATVLVGSDPASQVYVRNKNQATETAGMRSFHHELAADTPQAELDALIGRLNADPDVHGILVQSPLPAGLDEQRAFGLIDPGKDVDGFHPWNVGQLALGRPGLRSCTPSGVMVLLRDQGVDLVGAHAVVIGRSNIVGKPLALMLLAEHCTVTITHSRTRDLPAMARSADILVAAIGRPRFVTAEMVKPGAVVIDVGINRTDDGLVGDVDFGPVSEIASAITPVPRGVGPMTIAMLLRNTVDAARARFDA